ncbi:MAG TPA: twin-arginine translocation signal domain-containing protein [Rhodocyclaceae bacterium]|nr:twin-arginine translocation signal domain-containing protein [Rhodocyclaceae bacterium]
MKSDTNLKRRNFLLAATLGGVGAVTALVAEEHLAPPAAAAKEKTPPASQGYRATEHVRRYYATARI